MKINNKAYTRIAEPLKRKSIIAEWSHIILYHYNKKPLRKEFANWCVFNNVIWFVLFIPDRHEQVEVIEFLYYLHKN